MVNGRHQEVLVLSEPSGASIRLNGADVGSTPTTVRMRRRGVAVLIIDKVGYTAARISVSKQESGWMSDGFDWPMGRVSSLLVHRVDDTRCPDRRRLQAAAGCDRDTGAAPQRRTGLGRPDYGALRRANTSRLLATRRPEGLSDDVFKSAGWCVSGSSHAIVVDPPPSRLTASHTP